MVMLAFAISQASAADAAEVRYQAALDAWQHGDASAALATASDATAIDPSHRPARLLAGYALLNLNAEVAGLAVLESLCFEPVESQVEATIHRLASRTVHRVDDRNHRDQVSASFFTVVGPERGGESGTGAWRAAGAHVWQVGVPVAKHLTVRMEAQHRWQFDLEDVGGWRLTPSLAWTHTSRNTAVDLAVGPTAFIAHGVWWESAYHLYGGARVSAGADWRFGRRFGFRIEAGVTPLLLDRTLWWYDSPADVRLGVTTWFGQPRRGPLATVGGG